MKAHWGALALAGVVIATTIFASYYLRRVDNWRVMTDELLYWKLALGMSESLSPLPEIRGEHIQVYSILYPLIISPIVSMFDLPTAFKLTHYFNAFLIASAGIPAYLTMRKLSPHVWAAVLVAALVGAIPWLTLAASIMTESAAYPALAWALYLMFLSVAEPSPRNDILALVGLAIAYLARTQFIVLAMVFPLAVVFHEMAFALAWAPRRARLASVRHRAAAAVREHKVFVIVGALAALALLIKSPSGLLGSYAVTGQGELVPPMFWPAFRQHLAYILVGIGVIPAVVAVAWLLATMIRPESKRAHAFAVVGLGTVLSITAVATSFDLRFTLGSGTQERYLFYIVPVMFIGLIAGLITRNRLSLWMLLPATPIVLWAFSTGETFVPWNAFAGFASPNRFFYPVLFGRSEQIREFLGLTNFLPDNMIIWGTVIATALIGFALYRGWRVITTAVVGLLILTYGVLQTGYILPTVVAEHKSGSGLAIQDRDWIDQAIPEGKLVGALPSIVNSIDGVPVYDAFDSSAAWWDAEFWNKRVDRLYQIYGYQTSLPPGWDLVPDYKTGAVSTREGEHADMLLMAASDVRFAPQSIGAPVDFGRFRLYNVEFPLQSLWLTQGISADAWTEPKGTTIRVFPSKPRPERYDVRLVLFAGEDIGGTRRYKVSGPGLNVTGKVRWTKSRRFSFCLPPGKPTDIKFTTNRSTKLVDGRRVGVRLPLIEVVPSKKPC